MPTCGIVQIIGITQDKTASFSVGFFGPRTGIIVGDAEKFSESIGSHEGKGFTFVAEVAAVNSDDGEAEAVGFIDSELAVNEEDAGVGGEGDVAIVGEGEVDACRKEAAAQVEGVAGAVVEFDELRVVGSGGIIVNFGGEDFRWFDGIG